jgi:hypothetical protein
MEGERRELTVPHEGDPLIGGQQHIRQLVE